MAGPAGKGDRRRGRLGGRHDTDLRRRFGRGARVDKRATPPTSRQPPESSGRPSSDAGMQGIALRSRAPEGNAFRNLLWHR